ncbi:aspartyl protease [Alkalilimnicola ehrlichii]|uniref:Aspartyl protease n=1 Tax=Alkalilimnicola ehrlichii TaxID=351052 RepID=A0A3E0X1L8_9GAMM|nr:TIGR02281 family clan AA aspartic protease [Alkalilimnicola ehrlichii]RFA31165.1 aspartyl protease [Alkalilimnicola ehrlichii]RFA39549.1 aspartyl protease [Alkalilimnicola ehrlichii]
MNHQQTPQSNAKRAGTMMFIAMWILVLLLLTGGFNYWLEGQQNPNRNPGGETLVDGTREVTLQRNRYGHYIATGRINGEAVTFMLDTGASDISIPGRIAERLGLERGAPQQYRTAAGIITGYRTQLEQVELGPIALEDVRASINPHMDADEILLGMSFLKHLEFTQRGDRLTLRQY